MFSILDMPADQGAGRTSSRDVSHWYIKRLVLRNNWYEAMVGITLILVQNVIRVIGHVALNNTERSYRFEP